MLRNILIILSVFPVFLAAPAISSAQKKRPNILFIAIDDLKPEIGAFGSRIAKTPNIDKLTASGTAFMSNYCQQAVCGPTRASLMTGMRPDHTKVYNMEVRMRDLNPDILTLPQHLRAQGYTTLGIGKVYDPRCVDEDIDKPSWSVPYYKTDGRYYARGFGEPVTGRYQSAESRRQAERLTKDGQAQGMTKPQIRQYLLDKVKPSVENADVPDNAYNDGANVLQAIDILGGLAKQEGPFFFAVGLAKPHLPFVAPKKYWDLYRREDMPVAKYQLMSKGGVDVSMHNSGEIRAYTDIAPLIRPETEKSYGVTIPEDKQRELLHGYFAAISYTDANVGRLLKALDSLGLRENTIVVLWGDHGWHLGDHNLWCKHSTFEQATRTPLIISAPGIRPSQTRSHSEFVDIFPTLCELTGSPIPAHLHGKSQVAVMKNPTKKVKDFSVSQYPRAIAKGSPLPAGHTSNKVMGYALRSGRYRYTVWMGNDWKSQMPFDASALIGQELYDYESDPEERVNQSGNKTYEKVQTDMHAKMLAYFADARSRALAMKGAAVGSAGR
jgi:arylsulfatase A-like enzyme